VSEPEETSTDLRAAAVHGVRWIAISRPIVELLLLASMVLLARLVSPAEFGRFAVATAVAEFVVMIPSQAIGAALVQRATVTRGHLQAGSTLGIVLGLLLTALLLVLAPTVIAPIFGGRTADFVRLLAPGCLFPSLSAVPMASLSRRLAFRTLSIIDIVTTATRGAASVALALAGLDGEALIVGGLIAGAVGLVMAWVKAPPPAPRLRRQETRDILSYGLPAAAAAVSWVGFRNCDYAIVGARLGAAQAGLYFRAYTLAIEYQKKVSLVIGQIGFPVLSRSSSPEEMATLRLEMVRLLTVVLFPALALLAITAPVLIPWVFGAPWVPAIVPTQVLALGGASTLVIDAAGAVLMASSRTRALVGYGWAHFAVYAASVTVTAWLGLTAVAIGAAVVHTAFLLVAYRLMLSGTRQRTFRCLWGDVGPATASCLALAAAAVPVSHLLSLAHASHPLHLLVTTLAGVGAYCASLYLLHRRTWDRTLSFALLVLPTDRLRRRTSGLVPAGG
jgi:lipopolysaccharide exporter